MIFIALIKLPLNLLLELIRFSAKLEAKNKGYLLDLLKKLKRRYASNN